MKKRIISIIATLALLISSVPMNASAASVGKDASNSITNVETHITLFGTRYITYDFNGMNVDSRDIGASWNRVAFEHMSESDKRKVSGWYLPGDDRTEQFGEIGEQMIIKYINDSSGWSHAWKVMKDKIGKKYVDDLRQYYGGGEDAEDDKNSLYNEEIDRLTTFDKETAAYEVLTKYPYYEESEELFAMYGSIPEMMKVGKAGYDTCVNAYYQDISAGTKALSTFTLNFITDNCMVPGTFAAPSATMDGVRSAGYTLIMTARGTIRDMLNQITGDSKQFADEQLREAIAGGSGTSPEDAIKVMRAQEKIIDENYKLAKYCHEQCEIFREKIESKAQDVLDKIEENKTERDKEYAILKLRESERYAAAKPNISDDIARDNFYYDRITAAAPKADPVKDPDTYEIERKAWESVIQACRNELNEEFAEWKKNSASDLAEVLRSMGFDAVKGEDLPETETTYETKYYDIDQDTYNLLPDWMVHYWQSYNMERFSESRYLSYGQDIDDEKMQSIEDEVSVVVAKYRNAISKRDGFISDLENLAKTHEKEYESLYKKAKGITEAAGGGNISSDDIREKVISRDVRAAEILYRHKDSYYASYYVDFEHIRRPLGEEYYIAKIDDINNNMNRLRELREEYKKEMDESLDNYIEQQSLEDSLISEYNKIVKERNELLDSAPDYVKEQGLTNYSFSVAGYVDPELYTLMTGGYGTLRRMISEATQNTEAGDNYHKAKNAFLKKEADKLEPMYEKLRALDRRLRYIKDTETSVRESMKAVRRHTALSDENLDRYGINDHKGLHIETDADIDKKWDSSWKTENYDREKRAMKLLLSDFRGTGNLHMKFMQAYADYKAKRSSALSAVSAGKMKYDVFEEEIYDPLNGAYSDMISSSSVPTYSGPYTNIGKDSEIDFHTMYYDEGCEVQKTLEMAKDLESYVPVEGISPDEVNPIELNEGDTVQLSVTVLPANATSKKVNWESLSPQIAGVDENGLVTAYNEGEAVIRAVAADAPLTEIKDEDGNVTGYETPDEFVAKFTINVSSQYTYDEIVNADAGEGDETEQGLTDNGYSWANYGTTEEPRYILVTTDGDTTTVSARFNSNEDGSVAVMAVYDPFGALIGTSIVNNNDLLRKLSVSFDKDKQADRVKIFTWYSTQSLQPYSDIIIDEKI